MSIQYQQYFSTKQTPQSQPIPGTDQVANNAGGFAWAMDDWTRLDRFLILGSEGGTYYVGEHELTVQNAEAVVRCLKVDGPRVVSRVVEISEAGRAPKNDPALFVLALCAGMGDATTRQTAFAALPKVARIGTHLLHFFAYTKGFRGWGRGLRRAVVNWYDTLTPQQLAYQAVKYQNRDGWTQRDLLRLAHPKGKGVKNDLYHWIVKGWEGVGDEPHPDEALRLIWAYEKAKRADSAKDIIALVRDYGLSWEMLDTKWLSSAQVWEALLPGLPLTAMLRNLARMTANGLIAPLSKAAALAATRITDADYLKKSRVHPIAVLSALLTYQQGHGQRGNLTWQPVSQIVDALDSAFYLSFGNVEPTNKRIVLALDVSGSMASGEIAGVSGLTPRVGAAAMALITARTEPNHAIVAFAQQMMPLEISPRERLDDVVNKTSNLPFGGTDCALPMLWALGMEPVDGRHPYYSGGHKGYKQARTQTVQADAFVVLTDSESWFGQIHPSQALQQYRQKTGIAAKLIVVGMTATKFSISDPNDAGQLDCVGFDTVTPQLISDFIAH